MILSKSEKSFSLVFLLIVILELISGNIESLSQLHYFVKPLILISLIIFFWKQSLHLSKGIKNTTLLALLFSLAGDILLMFVGKSANFFMSGLVAFLLAHVMYILVFLKSKSKTRNTIPISFILVVYASGLFYLLNDGLGDMLIPVLAYMLVILTMVITASLRKKNISNISYNLVLIGAFFFLISDSILAINKFYEPFALSGIIIMITYALAQYLIVMGILKQSD